MTKLSSYVDYVKYFIQSHSSKIKWGLLGIICIMAVLFQLFVWGQTGYAQSWGGTAFKAISGGLLGWLISRFVINLNLSDISPEQRPLAALSQAIVIGAFAIALANGA